MPTGRHKSRSLRRVYRKTPKRNNKLAYKKRKPKRAQCGCCGRALKGVARERPYKMRKVPKTQKRPERPFGGVLCASCTRKLVVSKTRSE